jgi:Transposase IS66 family
VCTFCPPRRQGTICAPLCISGLPKALKCFHRFDLRCLLYPVEREAHEQKLCLEPRRVLCQALTKPHLNDLRAQLEREEPQISRKSPEGPAIAYTLLPSQGLRRCPGDSDLEIDKNDTKCRRLGIAAGRHNGMVYGSDHGQQTARWNIFPPSVIGSLPPEEEPTPRHGLTINQSRDRPMTRGPMTQSSLYVQNTSGWSVGPSMWPTR